MRGCLLLSPALVAVAVSCAASTPAWAAPTDTPLLIRQVAIAGPEYVMLQMTSDGQGSLDGETLTFYGPDGSVTRTASLSGTLAKPFRQRAILIATEAAAATEGFPTPDRTLSNQDALDPDGGAVCVSGIYPADCVTWSAFPSISTPAGSSLPNPQAVNTGLDPQGNPVPRGMVTRTIQQPCSTWLDRLDDKDNSRSDFDPEMAPAILPRNNATFPPEVPCVPDTIFNEAPRNPSNDTTPTFAFGEVPPDFSPLYECSFEGSPFSPCPASGNSFGPLADGIYEFLAKASTAGAVDPSPAAWTFEVDTVPPDTAITSTPAPISNGFSASFAFASSEHNPTFVCRLDNGPKQPCEPGKTYFFLSEGLHTFQVWASDQATNQDPTAAVHSFVVDTSFGDTFPPFTAIVSGPPNRTKLTSARFSYTSNEPGSRFECRIDSGPFSPCDPSGTTYPALRNGRHVFNVRAIDRAGNYDPTPDPYVWTVEGASPQTAIEAAPPGVTRTRKRRVRVRFAFSSSRPRSEFACRLDRRRFRRCSSPIRLKAGRGRHRFEVYAIDSLGNVDSTPARRIFRVVRKGSRGGLFSRPGRKGSR